MTLHDLRDYFFEFPGLSDPDWTHVIRSPVNCPTTGTAFQIYATAPVRDAVASVHPWLCRIGAGDVIAYPARVPNAILETCVAVDVSRAIVDETSRLRSRLRCG